MQKRYTAVSQPEFERSGREIQGCQLKQLSKSGTSVKESELRSSFLQPGQDTAAFWQGADFQHTAESSG